MRHWPYKFTWFPEWQIPVIQCAAHFEILECDVTDRHLVLFMLQQQAAA